ncbi:oligosaccharyl transferase alpha subunit [Trametes sanguinea]|nr:oligosaccharyl transferase alpha subunit [Trametes sanguinea]
MPRHWRAPLSLLFSFFVLPLCTSAANSFENTAIVRTVELGGALVHVTTTYAVKALEDGSSVYTLALGEQEHARTSWLEAKLKGQSGLLPLGDFGYHPESGVFLYTVELPKALDTNGTANLVVETVQTHATYPWPQEAAQKDPQSLKYSTELFVISPYKTAVQRTKIRSPTPSVHSYTDPEDIEFTTDSVVTKSGATITYGPFYDIPPSATQDFVDEKQKQITIHYDYEFPIVEITKLERTAEISHWGANLNIENKVDLHNAGPRLKGHFSRLEHQTQSYFGRTSAHILPGMNLMLPPGIHSAYFVDQIGNVSTSHLRTVPSVPKGSNANSFSLLELRPRYPVLGGWNYSFTFGWDSPLEDYAGYDSSTGKYVVGIPLLTPMPTAVVDEAIIKIILPEGATGIDYFPPYPALSESITKHISYLDTIGRPQITLKYRDLTDKHTGNIYVTYKVPFRAHLQKPLAVATAIIGVFIVALAWKRVDIRIRRK